MNLCSPQPGGPGKQVSGKGLLRIHSLETPEKQDAKWNHSLPRTQLNSSQIYRPAPLRQPAPPKHSFPVPETTSRLTPHTWSGVSQS